MPLQNDINTKISDTLSELGPAGSVAPIQNGLRLLNESPVSIQGNIYVSTAVSTNQSHPFWSLCELRGKEEGIFGKYFFHLYAGNNILPKKLGTLQPALAVIVLDDNLLAEEDLLYHLKRHSSQYSFLFVLNYTNNESWAETIKYEQYGRFISLNIQTVAATSLGALLDAYITADVANKLKDRCYLNSVQPILQLTREAVQQEQYIAGVRKNLNNQLGAILRKDEVGANINDIINNIKTQLQYWNSDAEKAVKLKYEELNKPSTGRYSQHLVKWSDTLEELDRTDIAEKAEKLATAVSKTFTKKFEKQLREEVETDFANDYNLILSATDSTLGKLNFLLEQKGISSSGSRPLALDYARFPNPDKTMNNYIGFTRTYCGEVSKKGAAEYFAALREHTGSIMVAVGLLAPLNMIAQASGSEAGSDRTSFMGRLADVMKDVRAYISFSTAGIIIIMIIWGYFDLRKRIPRKRKEEFERELKKARENLQTEGKRMFGDASKDWLNNVSQWLREAYGQLQMQLEKTVREYTVGQQQKMNEDKTRIQRLNQALDNNAKRISNAERIIEGALRNHKDAVSDVEKSFKT